jgi:hypothetical protein
MTESNRAHIMLCGYGYLYSHLSICRAAAYDGDKESADALVNQQREIALELELKPLNNIIILYIILTIL